MRGRRRAKGEGEGKVKGEIVLSSAVEVGGRTSRASKVLRSATSPALVLSVLATDGASCAHVIAAFR